MIRKCFVSGGVVGFARTPLAMLSETTGLVCYEAFSAATLKAFIFLD